MLREELLRSKKDEIARCLLMRKRKLSELYFATVGFPGATEGASADSLYQQKEQAFLDANDLSKGRYFNESTLPPLANNAAPLPRPLGKDALLGATGAESKTRKGADPALPPGVEAGVSVKPPAPALEHELKPQNQAAGQHPSVVPAVQTPVPEKHHGPSPSAVQFVPSPLRAEEKAKTFFLETPLRSRGHDVRESNGLSRSRDGPAPVDGVPAAFTPKPNEGPSPAVGPPHTADQPLSPVSSVEPCSTNTPVPVATSAETSPVEEAADAVEKIDQTGFERDKSSEAHANLVPSTPDEQLRLEEAQSLAAGKSISGITKNGYHPSANEVIQESIAPTSTVGKDQINMTQEIEIPSLPSEAKKPSETVPSLKPVTQEQLPAKPSEPVELDTKKSPAVSATLEKPQEPLVPPSERMMTRVSSGAIRHKSVSEILGETPKFSISQAEKAVTPARSMLVGPDKTASASAAKIRFKDRKEREKERSKLSTVVFPRQQLEKSESMDLVCRNADDMIAKVNEEQDYLFTLFQNRAYTPPRGVSLNTLLASAHKTLSTANHYLEYQEQMDCRALRRVYSLQNANRWPLRQLKRSVEPPREASHWDVLLDHMKWMRTDFREERKWKIVAAKSCADWCADYVNSDPEHREFLRIQARIPPLKSSVAVPDSDSSAQEMDEEMLGTSHPTPDLVPSAEEDSVIDGFNDEPRHDLRDTVVPAAIFSLGLDEFTFSMDMTPAADKLLGELPLYAPVMIAPGTNMPTFKALPDAEWKTSIVPVSKYATGHIKYHEDEPVRKRSRYDYTQYENERGYQTMELPPEQTDVALFRPEKKPIRDRIHPGHSFRPPTEYPMPSVGFFESRQSSQWTYAEDDELRRLVKEYSYNWSLISSCLTPSSQFTSGAERRTPWECFERWIGLEGLPVDMSKTQYFRAYHQRLETAQRNVLAQQQAAQQQQQQQGNSSQGQTLIRRRTTQPVRVDRRRSSRHLALLDAMRKLAKKRETMLQKQQHASHLASLRKANEANHPKPPISSPAEFSRLKYDREQKLQERQEQYRQQMLAQQRANLAAQRAGQIPAQQQMMNIPGRPAGVPHNPAAPGLPGNAPNGLSNGLPPGVGINHRPHSMQGIPGATPVNGPVPHNGMTMKMMPQAGIQPNGSRPGIPIQAISDNTRVIREANRLQEQQRILQSRQHQQQQQQGQQQPQPQPQQQQFHGQQFTPQGSHSPTMNMSNTNGGHNNPAMVAALQAVGGIQNPSSFHNGSAQSVSTPSPRMGQPNPLSSGVVPTINTIQSQIQRSNPNMPLEQVSKLATERLHQYQQQRMSQVAMNAAAGNLGASQANYQIPHDVNFQAHPQPSIPNGTPGIHIQGYSPVMRAPQNAQQSRVNVGNSPPVNGGVPQSSRSATPQTQRSGSVQTGSGPGTSRSPRAPQAQIASS